MSNPTPDQNLSASLTDQASAPRARSAVAGEALTSNHQILPKQSVELIRATLQDMRKHGLKGGLPQDHAFTLLEEIDTLRTERAAWEKRAYQAEGNENRYQDALVRARQYLTDAREAIGSFETRQTDEWCAELDAWLLGLSGTSAHETKTDEPNFYRDLQRALCDLSQSMGNPCLEIPEDGHLETALIDEATRRLTENGNGD